MNVFLPIYQSWYELKSSYRHLIGKVILFPLCTSSNIDTGQDSSSLGTFRVLKTKRGEMDFPNMSVFLLKFLPFLKSLILLKSPKGHISAFHVCTTSEVASGQNSGNLETL